MSFMDNVKTLTSKFGFWCKVHAPEIKTTIAVGGIIGGTVLTWRAAVKTNDILKESDEKLSDVDKKVNDKEITPEEGENQKKDIRKQEVWNVVKTCSGGAAVIVGTIAVTIENTVSMKRDISNATAAYFGLAALFNKYRERVREDQGAEKDAEYRYGAKTVEIKTTDIDGNEVTATVQTINKDDLKKYDYSFILDAGSWSQWTENDNANMSNIKMLEQFANERFRTRGVWYENETRRLFGLVERDHGWEVGNIYDPKDPDRDNYIHFNVYTFALEKSAGYMDPAELAYLIEPNIEGPIKGRLKELGKMGE